MNPRLYVLPLLEKNADELGIVWVNTKRKSDNWKAKVFEHKDTGLLFAIYDQKQTLVRLESVLPKIEGVINWHIIPKSSAFDSIPQFAPGMGHCVKVENLEALKSLLKEYIGVSIGFPTIKEINDGVSDLVDKAISDESSKRKKRLSKAPKKPKKRTVTITVYERNPDVIAEVLERAGGQCEICGNKAPFLKRKNGKPYLEVHHRIPLASGGDDTVENAVAACPNCHREEHYG